MGRRTTGTKAGSYAVVPPGFKGTLPAGVRRIQSPTNLVWVLGRTLLRDAADLPAVGQLMGGYKVTALGPWQAGERQGSLVFGELPDAGAGRHPRRARLLREAGGDPGRATRRPGATPAPCARSRARESGRARSRPGPPWSQPCRAGKRIVARAEARANRYGAARNNGWILPGDYVGAYGRNYLGRAVIATAALGANTRPETVYPLAVADVKRRPLSGAAPLHDPLPARAAPAGGRVLVDHDVRPGPLPRPQRDRPLRDRRPHRGTAQGPRRLADDLRAAPSAERRARARTGCRRRAGASGWRCASTSRAAAC